MSRAPGVKRWRAPRRRRRIALLFVPICAWRRVFARHKRFSPRRQDRKGAGRLIARIGLSTCGLEGRAHSCVGTVCCRRGFVAAKRFAKTDDDRVRPPSPRAVIALEIQKNTVEHGELMTRWNTVREEKTGGAAPRPRKSRHAGRGGLDCRDASYFTWRLTLRVRPTQFAARLWRRRALTAVYARTLNPDPLYSPLNPLTPEPLSS